MQRSVLRQILVKDFKLKWKKVKNQPAYINSANNIWLRCVFAQKLIRQLMDQKVILNFDETQISSSCPRTFSWASTKEGTSR